MVEGSTCDCKIIMGLSIHVLILFQGFLFKYKFSIKLLGGTLLITSRIPSNHINHKCDVSLLMTDAKSPHSWRRLACQTELF